MEKMRINRWITPPELQGQVIDVSYAGGTDCVFKRVHDRSDNSISYFYSIEAWESEEDFEPWNCEPEASDWVECEEPKFEGAPKKRRWETDIFLKRNMRVARTEIAIQNLTILGMDQLTLELNPPQTFKYEVSWFAELRDAECFRGSVDLQARIIFEAKNIEQVASIQCATQLYNEALSAAKKAHIAPGVLLDSEYFLLKISQALEDRSRR